MQYELYTQLRNHKNRVIFFILESNNLKSILTYTKKYPLNDNLKYIIVNNCAFNFSQLGFTEPPTHIEYYNIIFECKLAKEYYRQIMNNSFTTDIYNSAKLHTDIYFENLYYNNKNSTFFK